MKKIFTLIIFMGSLLLTGCGGKESQLKTAINELHSFSGVVIPTNNTSPQTMTELDKKYPVKPGIYYVSYMLKNGSPYSPLSDGMKTDIEKLDALTNVGLLSKQSIDEQVVNGSGRWQTKNDYRILIYTLTPKGNECFKHTSNVITGNVDYLSYANLKLVNIENYIEASDGSISVKYTYKLVDIADWVKMPEIEKVYKSQITDVNSDTPLIAKRDFVKTANGYSTGL